MNNTNVQKQREYLVDVNTKALFAWSIPLSVFSFSCYVVASVFDYTMSLGGISLVFATALLLLGEFIFIPSLTLVGYGIILHIKEKTAKMGPISSNVRNVTVWGVSLVSTSVVFYIVQILIDKFAHDKINSSATSRILFLIFNKYCEVAVFVGITLVALSWILRIVKDRRDLKHRKK